jgi:large subunit ribosomal protein L13Ae
MFEKQVVIDCRGHLLGRLASTIAKELLAGQKIVAVRCEGINISGSLYRNKLKYLSFLRKRTNTNPRHGPFHYRAPGKILWRVVRGMLPHKTAKGAAALSRFQVFEGVPPPFDQVKRLVVPHALRALRLGPDRAYTVLGRLSSEVGWKYAGVVNKLEDKRRTRAAAYYQRAQALAKIRRQAIQNVAGKLTEENKLLSSYGYNTSI